MRVQNYDDDPRRGLIYIATNILNKKSYIGQTIQGFDVRKRQHIRLANNSSKNHPFLNALRKNPEKFVWKILERCSIEDLDTLEKKYIMQYESVVPGGYNLDIGGNSNKIVSLETRKKISRIQKGKILSLETKEKIRMNHSRYWKGKKRSKKNRENMSRAWTQERREAQGNRIRAIRKGKTLSEEHKVKIKASFTPERRQEISEQFKGKPWSPARRAAQERRKKRNG